MRFHKVILSVCPRPRPSGIDGRLRPKTRKALDRLRRASCYRVTTFIRPDRAIVRLPEQLSQGNRVELVLRSGPGNGAIVQRDSKRFWWGEPARLADLLEGTPPVQRAEAKVKFLDEKPGEPMLPQKFETTRLDAVGQWKTAGHTAAQKCDTRFAFTVWHSTHPSLPVKAGRMLINLALMPLSDRHGWEALRQVRSRVGFPLAWKLAMRCRAWPARRIPVAAEVRVIPGGAGSPSAQVRMAADKARLPPPAFRRRFGPLPTVSRQEVPTQAMRSVRAPQGSHTRPSTGRFTVRNSTQRFVHVLTDGFRIGGVAPNKTFVFKHMPPGYYRVTAASPWFIRSWGPRDMYVPGTWTIK